MGMHPMMGGMMNPMMSGMGMMNPMMGMGMMGMGSMMNPMMGMNPMMMPGMNPVMSGVLSSLGTSPAMLSSLGSLVRPAGSETHAGTTVLNGMNGFLPQTGYNGMYG